MTIRDPDLKPLVQAARHTADAFVSLAALIAEAVRSEQIADLLAGLAVEQRKGQRRAMNDRPGELPRNRAERRAWKKMFRS